ncbi:hypothetical protein, partial [Endozoicomonas atrinae]|uniref:hypothetical protein n=1 Tax=Endozoicomonas atrinae TaxID=1333660 RepID=UPI001EE763F5
MADITGMSSPAIYRMIDQIWKHCIAYTAYRERKLQHILKDRYLHIAVDRQEYTVNWKSRYDRRFTILLGIA